MILERDTQLLSLASLALAVLLWACGGVLLTGAVAGPPRRERLILGLATGLLLFVSLSNCLANFLPVTPAFWLASSAIFVAGLFAAVGRPRQLALPGRADLPYAALFVATLCVAFSINRGLAILDDYHNLPLVSTMGAGYVPPVFYLNSDYAYAYHYGLHIVAASLVDLGGLTPWGAFDLSKALTIALALPLAALSLRRVTSRVGWMAFGTAVFAFLGGTRWLLLLVPGRWVDALGSPLVLLGSAAETGANLQEVLLRSWAIAGNGPLPFPFAFLSGIRPPATFVTMSGSAVLPEVTLLVLLLLHRRDWRPATAALFAVLTSTLALTSETLFLVAIGSLVVGLALAFAFGRRRGWDPPKVRPVILILGTSLAMALLQGGVFTQLFRTFVGSTVSVYGFAGISLVWPPRVVSAHLGSMGVGNFGQLLLALLEAGPAVLLLPLVLAWSGQHLRRGMSFPGGLGPATLMLALAGLVLQYEIVRESSRFPGTALMVWTVFALQPLIVFLRDRRGWLRFALAGSLVVGMFGGMALLATQLVAAGSPVRTYFVSRQDALMADLYWDRLEPEAVVLDRDPYRGVTLFGRPSRSHQSYWETTPAFNRLVAAASPREIAQAGYPYVYMDEAWWSLLSAEQQGAFATGCATKVHQEMESPTKFRILYDVRGCSVAGPE
jgi:hypothetical protein